MLPIIGEDTLQGSFLEIDGERLETIAPIFLKSYKKST